MPADLEHPWLGLESYQAETRAYFFGREPEIAALHLRLRSHPLLVLYGRSGLGKTSILNAGLLPRLVAEQQFPVIHRFDYNNERVGPTEQLMLLLFSSREDEETWSFGNAAARSDQWAKELREKLSFFDLPEDEASWFWLRVHWRAEPPAITHLVLDQFEEVFTRGAEQKGLAEEIRDRIVILLHGGVPPAISSLIAKEDTFLDYFDPDSQPVRVILSLRDDYVYALNRWRQHLPALGENNFELRPLRGFAAFEAIFKPGALRCHYRGEVSSANKVETGLPPIMSEETARRIVHFSSKKGQEIPIEEIEAVPPILSLLCRELNERRFTSPPGSQQSPAEEITFRESDADIETVITAFYERCLAGRPEAVRVFIEEELVSYSGARLSQDEQSILKVFEEGCEIPGAASDHRARGFGDAGLARACLRDLVNQRLLSPLGGETPSYELIHDLLAGVVEKTRAIRREREASARLAARQQERLRRQRKIALVVVAALVLGCAVLVTYAYRTRQEIKFRALIDSGNFLLETNDNRQALEKFKEATRINSSAAEAWSGMGEALLRQAYGSDDSIHAAMTLEAIEALNQAVEIEKRKNSTATGHDMSKANLAKAYVRLGNLYAQGTDPDFPKAEALYKQAAATDPGSPYLYDGYASVQMSQWHFRLAMKQYEAALKVARQRNEPDYNAHAGLAEIYLVLGHYGLAMDQFNRAIGAYPDSWTARFGLARAIFLSDPNDPRAVELFKSLLGSEMKRLDSLVRMNLAYTLLAKAKLPTDGFLLAEAVGYLEEAYEKDPHALSAFRLGIGRALQGNSEEASRLWQETSKLPWGDSLSRRTYSPVLAALRSEPGCLAQVREITQLLAQEGAVGFLETVKRDAELIHTSELYNAEISPVITLLNEAISEASQHNKLPTSGVELQVSPPPR
jgi:tetratricopeptide (TPR) repeat protein